MPGQIHTSQIIFEVVQPANGGLAKAFSLLRAGSRSLLSDMGNKQDSGHWMNLPNSSKISKRLKKCQHRHLDTKYICPSNWQNTQLTLYLTQDTME